MAGRVRTQLTEDRAAPRVFIERFAWLWLALLVLLIFWRTLLLPGTLGLRDDWPIPPLREQNIELAKRDTLYSWGSDALGHPINRQAGSYVDWSLGALATLVPAAGGPVISRYPVVFLWLAAWGMYRLLRHLGLKVESSLFGAAAYILSPFVFNSFIAGYLKFFVSYAAIPFFLDYFWQWLEQGGRRRLIGATIALGLVGTSLNFLVLFLPFTLLTLIFWAVLEWRKRGLTAALHQSGIGLTVFVGPLVLQAPVFVEPLYQLISGQGSRVAGGLNFALDSFITLRATSLYESLSLLSFFPEYFRNDILSGQGWLNFTGWQVLRLPLLLLVFFGLASWRRNRLIGLAGLGLLLGLFLLKGPNPPLGGVNIWLVQHFPLMALLRNIGYVIVLLSPLVAWLLAVGFETLLDHLPRRRFFIGFSLVALLLWVHWPFLSGDFNGNIQSYRLKPETEALYRGLRSEAGEFRVWQLPMHSPMRYDGVVGRRPYPGFNPMVWHAAKPSLWMGVHQTYSHFYHNLVSTALHFGSTEQLGYLLSLANVKTVILDEHFEPWYDRFITVGPYRWLREKSYNLAVKGRLEEQKDLERQSSLGQVSRYENRRFQEAMVTSPADFTLVVGGGDLIEAQALVSGPDELARPVAFASELATDRPGPPLETIRHVWLDPDERLTLDAMFLRSNYSYNPASALRFNSSDAMEEWVDVYKNQWWWYHPRLSSSETPVLTFQSEQRLSLPVRLAEGRNRLFLKVWQSPRSVGLKVKLGERSLGTVLTLDSTRGHWQWVDLPVQNGPGEQIFSLETVADGEEAAARLLVVPDAEWALAEAAAEGFINAPDRKVVTVRTQNQRPAIEDGSFEGKGIEGQWRHVQPEGSGGETVLNEGFERGVGLPCPEQAGDEATRSREQPGVGQQSLRLIKRSRSEQFCTRLAIPNFDPNLSYEVSLRSRWLQGGAAHFSIIENGQPVVIQALVQDRAWRPTSLSYQPGVGATEVIIELGVKSHPAAPEVATIAEFDQLTVRQVRAGSCTQGAGDEVAVLADRPKRGSRSLRLIKRSPGGFLCVRQTLQELVPGASYRIALWSYWQQGGAPHLGFGNGGEPERQLLSQDPRWFRYTINYRQPKDSRTLELELSTNRLTDSATDTVVFFDEVSVERLLEPPTIEGEEGLLGPPPEPLLSEKPDPTRYRVLLPQSFNGNLVLAEQWHPDWRIYRLDQPGEKKERIRPLAHFEVNGFSNGFVLDPGLAGKRLLLEYGPQPIYEGTVLVQFIASGFVLVFVCWPGLVRLRRGKRGGG